MDTLSFKEEVTINGEDGLASLLRLSIEKENDEVIFSLMDTLRFKYAININGEYGLTSLLKLAAAKGNKKAIDLIIDLQKVSVEGKNELKILVEKTIKIEEIEEIEDLKQRCQKLEEKTPNNLFYKRRREKPIETIKENVGSALSSAQNGFNVFLSQTSATIKQVLN
jgi:hypothetical protein